MLLDNSYVRVTRTTMQAGAELPPERRTHNYVILPVTRFSVIRRFVRGARVAREVAIEGEPGKPYFGRATRGEARFALVNNSDSVIAFDKVVLKR